MTGLTDIARADFRVMKVCPQCCSISLLNVLLGYC